MSMRFMNWGGGIMKKSTILIVDDTLEKHLP